MYVKRIEGATRTLGAPNDWDESKGKCHGLPVLDAIVDGLPCMISAWEPSPEEIHAMINGESVKLWIYGNVHPVVSLTVGDVEKA